MNVVKKEYKFFLETWPSIEIFVTAERTEEAFECEILAQDVELVKYFSGQTQPVLFLLLTQESGEKLREICHMEPGDDEYFDPSSTGRSKVTLLSRGR